MRQHRCRTRKTVQNDQQYLSDFILTRRFRSFSCRSPSFWAFLIVFLSFTSMLMCLPLRSTFECWNIFLKLSKHNSEDSDKSLMNLKIILMTLINDENISSTSLASCCVINGHYSFNLHVRMQNYEIKWRSNIHISSFTLFSCFFILWRSPVDWTRFFDIYSNLQITIWKLLIIELLCSYVDHFAFSSYLTGRENVSFAVRLQTHEATAGHRLQRRFALKRSEWLIGITLSAI